LERILLLTWHSHSILADPSPFTSTPASSLFFSFKNQSFFFIIKHNLHSASALTETSQYVADLGAALAHFRTEYLSKISAALSAYSLPPDALTSLINGNKQGAGPAATAGGPTLQRKSAVEVLVERFASRVVVLFLRHASLIDRLNAAGKLQLAKDLSEFEAAVGQVRERGGRGSFYAPPPFFAFFFTSILAAPNVTLSYPSTSESSQY
jgi:hypothetical protein